MAEARAAKDAADVPVQGGDAQQAAPGQAEAEDAQPAVPEQAESEDAQPAAPEQAEAEDAQPAAPEQAEAEEAQPAGPEQAAPGQGDDAQAEDEQPEGPSSDDIDPRLPSFYKRRGGLSTMTVEKCSFNWTIEYFSCSSVPVGCPKVSNLFPGEKDDDKCKWILLYYPNGEREDNKEYVGLELVMKRGPGTRVVADIELYLKDTGDRVLFYRRDECYFDVDVCFAWEKLSQKYRLMKILEDDTLVIQLNVTSYLDNMSKFYDPAPQLPHLRMAFHYARLRKSGKLSDATIVVRGKKFPVHSVVLAARSPVFMAMFEHQTVERETCVITIEDIDSQTMGYLLDFIYKCEIPNLDVTIAMNLLKAAEKYDLSDLKDCCVNFLATSLCRNNAIEILYVANIYSAVDLKGEAMEYICTNRSLFSRPGCFDDLERKDPNLFRQVIHRILGTS